MSKKDTEEKIELNNEKKRVAIKETIRLIEERYVYPDVAKTLGKALHNAIRKGFFDEIKRNNEFAHAVWGILKETCKDKHLYFLYEPELFDSVNIRQNGTQEEKHELEQKLLFKNKQTNFGFLKLEILEGNIGFLDLRGFHNSDEALEMGVIAMNFLKNTNAIIIDLRNNGGGENEMVNLLASYFLEKHSQLNNIVRRFEDITDQHRAFPFVPGKRMLDTKLYLLTSSSTFSAAEDFIYALKCQKRAVLVGEQTKGGGHPIDFYTIADTFVLMLPNARSLNPISKSNWEGIGISPDIQIPADQAFEKAYSLAIDYSIENESDQITKLFLQLAKAELVANSNKFENNDLDLKHLAGSYGPYEILFENNDLVWKTRSSGKVHLTPKSDTLFVIEKFGFDDVAIMFEHDLKTNEIFLHMYYKRPREVTTVRRDTWFSLL